MANKHKIRAAVVCHKGCVRGNNEDNFFFNGDYMPLEAMDKGAMIEHIFTDRCLAFAVVDGMGGGDFGERASAMSAQYLSNVYLRMQRGDLKQQFEEYCTRANSTIYQDSVKHHVDFEGSTVAALLIRGSQALIGNVGDSRVYVLSKGKMKQLSMDHSLVGVLVRAGQLTPEQARKSPQNNEITQYLGMNPQSVPKDYVYTQSYTIHPGDRFMICSDGLSDLMSDETIEQYLAAYADPCECATVLVRLALELGGKDNTTCIVVDANEFTAVVPLDEPTTAPLDNSTYF